jgi:methenyltetrahydromethanopterin cyclohydrolase
MPDMNSLGPLQLNQRAADIVAEMMRQQATLRVAINTIEGGGHVLDAGVASPGGLAAGVGLARLCLGGLGAIDWVPGDIPHPSCPRIQVRTDHPVAACMASQYAGWKISVGDFFAMGSGPMRAAYGGEELFEDIGHREIAQVVVGVLESNALPGRDVFDYIAEKTGVDPGAITLAVAPTRSLAGSIQVVARSVETALHKLHALGFDLSRVESGLGSAPLPPPAKNDLAALGRTNDAVLYGARVTLWVRGDDESLAEVGPFLPSSASADYGAPFGEIFERYGHDFYKVDPALFSPAEITFSNLDTGRTLRFGQLDARVLEQSFFGTKHA